MFSPHPPPLHRGKEFILNHLRMQDVSCYWEKLLTEYSRLLTYKPRRRKDYNQVVHRARKTELWGRGTLERTRVALVDRNLTQGTELVHRHKSWPSQFFSKGLILQHSCLFLYKLFRRVPVCLCWLKVSTRPHQDHKLGKNAQSRAVRCEKSVVRWFCVSIFVHSNIFIFDLTPNIWWNLPYKSDHARSSELHFPL